MAPILALEKISKRFGAVVVADGVNLALNAGEALGIIGPNGAGKSTLLNLLSGIYQPDSGALFFEEHDLTGMPAHERVRRSRIRGTGSRQNDPPVGLNDNPRRRADACRIDIRPGGSSGAR